MVAFKVPERRAERVLLFIFLGSGFLAVAIFTGLLLQMAGMYTGKSGSSSSSSALAPTAAAVPAPGPAAGDSGAVDGAAAACASEPDPEPNANRRIPKILHHVYISGREEFEGFAKDPRATFRPEWAHWCKAVHHDWEYKFWDNASAEALLQESYPWFMEVWRQYDKVVYKGDSLRYFLMHKFGGVYMDLDVECFREGSDMLEGSDVVIQATSFEEGVTNAVVASVPGHPLWENVFKLLKERVMNGGPIYATGPNVVFQGLLDLGLFQVAQKPEEAAPDEQNEEEEAEGAEEETEEGEERVVAGQAQRRRRGRRPQEAKPPGNPYVGTYKYKGTKVKIYPMGSWLTPCWFADGDCHRELAYNRSIGILNKDVVGYHHYTGTWNRLTEKEGLVTDLTYAEAAKGAVCSHA